MLHEGVKFVNQCGRISRRNNRHAIYLHEKHFRTVLSQVQGRLTATVRGTRDTDNLEHPCASPQESQNQPQSSSPHSLTGGASVRHRVLTTKAIAVVGGSFILVVANGKFILTRSGQSTGRDPTAKVVMAQLLSTGWDNYLPPSEHGKDNSKRFHGRDRCIASDKTNNKPSVKEK